MQISSSIFPFSFFLSDRVEVKDLEKSAVSYGGATLNKKTNKAWSNIQKTEYITITDNNTIGIFIPDTVNVSGEGRDKQMEILKKIDSILSLRYNNITFEDGLGTWYSDSEKCVVYDNIIIVSVTMTTLNQTDIKLFVELANMVKAEMSQEGVSIAINDALAIV